MLHRATKFASTGCDAPASFERVLSETLSSTYAWTFRALDGLLGSRARPTGTARIELLLVDMIEACDVRRAFDPGTAKLQEALMALLRAARTLSGGEPSEPSWFGEVVRCGERR